MSNCLQIQTQKGFLTVMLYTNCTPRCNYIHRPEEVVMTSNLSAESIHSAMVYLPCVNVNLVYQQV